MGKKTAFITGITGQDGAYLSRLLLEKGYRVVGGYRRTSTANFWRLEELRVSDKIELVEIDLQDAGNLARIITDTEPDEVYNLGAQSFVGVSFKNPVLTGNVTGIGVTNILEAIRLVNTKIKFYQASTSELYGIALEKPQHENTPFYPRSPYGVAKLYGHFMTINYRESYDMFASTGILFNHESPLRGMEFVTRKITDAVSRIHHGIQDYFEIGNMDAIRDWGFAGDYVKGMWQILQHPKPDNFVLATGESHSVREWIEACFVHVGKKITWKGASVDEQGVDQDSGKVLVKVNPRFFRPAEVDYLQGDYSKAKRELDWHPETSFSELVSIMMEKDLARIAR